MSGPNVSSLNTAKRPEDLVYWMGKDVTTMTRDELEVALRQSCVLYNNLLESNLERGRFTADLMRFAARR